MFEHPFVCLFIGPSGAGKGTQAGLLAKRLEELDPSRKVFRLETGEQFRQLASGASYTSRLAKNLIDEGKLEPAFLAVQMWSHPLIESYQGTEHVLIDGTPRVFSEMDAFDSAIEFYQWKPHVLFINVSDGWARERLIGRKRFDDIEASDIEERLTWFHRSVVPVIERLRRSPSYLFHQIHGEQTIEEVHQEIRTTLGI